MAAAEFECTNGMCRFDSCHILKNLEFQFDRGGCGNAKAAKRHAEDGVSGGWFPKDETDSLVADSINKGREWHCFRQSEVLAETRRWQNNPRIQVT
jgi:hypothetical protein